MGWERLVAELRRGMLAVLLLKLLEERGDLHGYALRRLLREAAGWEPPESTVYDVLKRLEKLGLVESYWAVGLDTGAVRRFYRVTPRGREALRRLVEELTRLATPLCRGEHR